MSDTHQILKTRFGLDSFRPGQESVINNLLEGRSAAAVFPTGGGKSLCYQLPALMLPGLTLVVSPLIALMKDQIDKLQELGIPAARLDSTLSLDEYRSLMDDLRAGHLKLLYVAPERFNNERFREAIRPINISLMSVDEAHCISEWGHAFRPDYLKLVRYGDMIGAERYLALTATATPQVLEDIKREFRITDDCAVRTEFYRPNLTLTCSAIERRQRDAYLTDQIRTRPSGPTIVYVTLQKTAMYVANMLAEQGLPAKAYHAGMRVDDRTSVQEWFIQSDTAIVVATIAFGMGIDKSNIRYVYHYNLAKSLENYAQEIGRAGRDGEDSVCEMIICMDDLNALENFAYGDTPSYESIRGMVQELFTQREHFDISTYELSAQYDIRALVINTLLTYLELDGYLEALTPYYSSYQFKPNMPSAQILDRFQGERRTFLATVLKQSRKAKIWFTIDVDEAAKATNSPRDRVIKALDYLHDQGMIELKVGGIRNPYHRLRYPDDPDALTKTLHDRTMKRESREIERLNQVLTLASADTCQVGYLSAHFGENLEEGCGHCSWCTNGNVPLALPERPSMPIDDNIWQQAADLKQTYPQPLNDPRAMTRFLCGLSSPKATRLKLSSHDLYGVLDSAAFADVLAKVNDL